MTDTLMNAPSVQLYPETADGLAELSFETGDYDLDDYAISIRDAVDTIAIVGTLDELETFEQRLHEQIVKLRRYDKSLTRAKAKLEGRLKS